MKKLRRFYGLILENCVYIKNNYFHEQAFKIYNLSSFIFCKVN
jgi:hypothetical protein